MAMSPLAPSTLATQLMRRDTILRVQSEIDRAAQEVSTGRHANSYEALGHDAAQSLRLEANLGRTEAFLTSNALLENRMGATATALSGMRKIAQEVLSLAMPNADAPGQTAGTLASQARAAFDQIAALANTSYEGRALFAGVATDARALAGWQEEGPGGVMSPAALVASVAGGGPTTGTEAAAMAEELDDAFAGAAYDTALYGGAPADGPRLGASIDTGETLDWGIQANDPAFRDLMQGLAMLAGVDAATIKDPEAYRAWMGHATGKLSSGLSGLLESEAALGGQQARLADMVERQEGRKSLYTKQINDLEGVDPYEAASRMTETQGRLQASYEVSARILNLSFLDYMR
ncbi:hypothetical protein OCH239_00270 [Roseivivax halodurans JCM 10272]|uniref:Flagellin n=1 Tax=Roseivivax halodurans JCM 10272 TaxID=1449350 RepID=X7ELB6_9RHOB|nr:flagellin [Roseivivax halodurans]ETX16700.1 hypothetical protein OCH239_00270 [Roseivivax halodurans JCM 10272]